MGKSTETNRAAVGVERMEEIGVQRQVSFRENKNVLKVYENAAL